LRAGLGRDHKVACHRARELALARKSAAPFCAVCDVAAVLRALCDAAPRAPAAPVLFRLAEKPHLLGSLLVAGRQEDPHEFLLGMLAAMQSRQSCLGASGPPGRAAGATFVTDIFGGVLQTTTTCPHCFRASTTTAACNDLCLGIGAAGALARGSVEGALARFFEPETLDAANMWLCPGCAVPVRATAHVALSQTAPVLCVQLKRFVREPAPGRATTKLAGHVAFGRTLDVPRATAGGERGGAQPAVYDLFGVLVHRGDTLHAGHFLAYVKGAGGAWHEMNDASATRASWADVEKQEAYMLFYALRQPPAPALGEEAQTAPAAAPEAAPEAAPALPPPAPDVAPAAAPPPTPPALALTPHALPALAPLPNLARLAAFPKAPSTLSAAAPEFFCAPPAPARGELTSSRVAGAAAHTAAASVLRDPGAARRRASGKRRQYGLRASQRRAAAAVAAAAALVFLK
jgi:ubiquitin carboxyl-terminal hydrolase 36/42